MMYPNRHTFSKKSKIILCDALVLSQCNYCDFVYGPCLTARDAKRIQILQNSCLRFIYGIRKYDRISHTLSKAHWLDIANRRKLHANILYHKILTSHTPAYLHNKIKYRTDIHNINIRRKDALTIPQHKSSLFRRSFVYNIAAHLNELPRECRSLSVKSFRTFMFNLLYKKQEGPH